jgi:hypothetical protein
MSIYEGIAGLYKSENRTWIGLDSQASKVEIIESNGSYRISGTDFKSGQPTLTLQIAPDFTFTSMSATFGQLSTSNGAYGFNFPTGDDLSTFNQTLNQVKNAPPPAQPAPPAQNKRLSQVVSKKGPISISQSRITNPELREARDEILKAVKLEMETFRNEILNEIISRSG